MAKNLPGGVSRTSPVAITWADLLKKAGVTLSGRTVTPRAIEDLKGLAPPRDAPPEHVIAHFAQLDALGYGPGCDPNHIARVMLTRGFPREPARLAIRRGMTGGDPEASAPLTHQTLTQLVMAMGGTEAVVPDVTKAWQQVEWVAGVVDRLASMTVIGGRLDSYGHTVGPQEETPDQRRHAIANMFVSAVVGDELEDTTPLSDLEVLYDAKGKVRHDERGHYWPAPTSPEEEDQQRGRLETIARVVANDDVLQVLATAPLTDLAEAAAASRSTARTWRRLGGKSDDPESVDDDAAMLAPIALLVGQKNWPKDGAGSTAKTPVSEAPSPSVS